MTHIPRLCTGLSHAPQGGTTGCILARRLAESKSGSVLLVERGDARNGWLDRVPLLSTHSWSDRKHSVTVPGKLFGDRTTDMVAGSGLGGTSRINGMQHTRGIPGQYNGWAESGRKGWGYEDLKPYFDKAESVWNPEAHLHYGSTGGVHVYLSQQMTNDYDLGPLQIEAPPTDFKFGASEQYVCFSFSGSTDLLTVICSCVHLRIGRGIEKTGFLIHRDANDPTLPTSGGFMIH